MINHRPPKYTTIEQGCDVFTKAPPQAVLEHIQRLTPQDKQALDAWAQVWRKRQNRQGLTQDAVLGACGFAVDAVLFGNVTKQDALLVATVLQARLGRSCLPLATPKQASSTTQDHQGRA